MGSSATAYYDDLDRMNELSSKENLTEDEKNELKGLERIYKD